MSEQKVIIVGGGPVGLSAAICLAQQKIASIVIEKHPTTTSHPKARGVNGRTMELFRSWGLEEPLKKYEMPREAYRFTWLEDFQGDEITRVQATVDYSQYSPTKSSVISQDNVEQELFQKAKNLPLVDLRFSEKMVQVSQDVEKVTVTLDSGEKLKGDYLIAADGAKSSVRKHLNIEMEGEDNLGTFCNIYCEMDLDKYVAHRPSVGFMFTRPDLRGTFILSKNEQRKWLVGVRLNPDRSLTKERFTDDFCVDYVKKTVNDSDVKVHFINKSFWTMAALIAKQYRVGRVFLAGDAAHQLPPTGGFGMNTGIQDVHNLAWKLARVMRNAAEETLLDTYFTERAQIAKTNIFWSMGNAKRFEKIFKALGENDLTTFKEALQDQTHHINNILLDLGFVYGSEYQLEEKYIPSTKVGARAPHCWLIKDGKEISTLDLYWDQFVLICHPEADHWRKEYRESRCKIVTVGEKGEYQDRDRDFLQLYAISKQGAVLVRPDGHVAWRADDEKGMMIEFDGFLN